ncbi:MAG TPA: hypothetical protein VKC89_01760 [Patescibacteria group bacterium]|nr:hypothetical protein [Patescibacteria group bacterium]
MKIYIAHSTNYDFKNELYVPLRNSALNSQHDIVLPHENDTFIKTKDIIRESDLVIAETSYPSTGEGIELGWADSFKVPVVCISKEGTKISNSLKTVSDAFIVYRNSEDLIDQLIAFLASKVIGR